MEFKKGYIPWNKGKTGVQIAWNKGKKRTWSSPTEFKKGMIPWNKGKKGVQVSSRKGKENPLFQMENNPNWNGGKKISHGYNLILKKNHPFCNNQGYVREHRLVMENFIGRFLKKTEQGHHVNKIRLDNRIENLMLFSSNSAHRRFHNNPNNVKPSEIIFDGRNYFTSKLRISAVPADTIP